MRVRYFQIAGGNDTALVWGLKPDKRKEISVKLLEKVEQAGFIEETSPPGLIMMGDELCINAALAAAFSIGGIGKIMLNDTAADFIARKDSAELALALPYKQPAKNTVIFKEIGYILADEKAMPDKRLMRKLCASYKLPAFGLVRLSGRLIDPYIYVRQTDSLINETACGSGSVAVSILRGYKTIKQPAGGMIKVVRKPGKFVVSAKVSEVRE